MTRLCAVALFVAVAAWGQAPLGQGQVLILVGPPGSGKTVQAGMLSKKYKIPAVSVAAAGGPLLLDVRQLPAGRHLAVPADDAAARQCGVPQKPDKTHAVRSCRTA